MCTFSEGRPARVCCHRDATGETMACSPCSTESSIRLGPGVLPEKDVQYQASDQQVSWDLYPGP